MLLLESGGVDFDATANALNTLDPSESPYATHSESRRRQLGGTAHKWNTRLGNSWGARFIRLSGVDFEPRDWMPDSGWPFGLGDLEPYYDQAETLCGVSHQHDDMEAEGAWFGCVDSPLRTYVERFGLSRIFTHQIPSQLRAARRVVVVTHATVTELLTDPSGVRIEGVRFQRPGGATNMVTASVVVLAAGGIENARLLLLSRGVHQNGLGNNHDLVGRYFMDHHRLDWGILLPARPELFESAGVFDLMKSGHAFRMGKLTIGPAELRSHTLLNTSLQLTPRLSEEHHRVVELMRKLLSRNSGAKLQTMAALARNRKLVADVSDTGMRLAWHQRRFSGRIDEGMWSRLPRNGIRFGSFGLLQIIEQSPSPGNRVMLIDDRDSLGQPRVQVECRLQPLDIDSAQRARSLIAESFDRRHLGVVVANEGLPLQKKGGIHHHIGTTRMHVSPRKGVTDAKGEVHDVHNLFIVGSSVFPTGGYANPTLTILALALRTADCIGGRLTSPYSMTTGRDRSA